MKPVSVAFIGSGNVAWHLAPAMENTGFAVREVYSRKRKNAAALAERLYEAKPVTDLDFSKSAAKVFFLCVSDDAIKDVLGKMVLPPESILVHTSGGQPLSVLGSYVAKHTGVFYPLQTFTKGRKIDFRDLPFFIESEDAGTEKILMGIARSLTKKVVRINSQQRRALHVAAVFASNFTNHMLTLSKEVMVMNEMKFDFLRPLIVETLNKSLDIGPENAQTGPARRGDLEVLDVHMKFLESDPPVAEIYRQISQHILDSYAVE